MKDPITPQKDAPIRLNIIIYVRRLEKIAQVMSYINIAIPEFNELDFWHHFGWEMFENTLDEETESVGDFGRRMRARRVALGDNEFVTAPKIM